MQEESYQKLNLALKASQEQSANLTLKLTEAEDELNSPFTNPLVMVLLGGVIGALVTK